jgi:hypothetical protein
VAPPPAKVAINEDRFGRGDVANQLGDRDESTNNTIVPTRFRLLH